MNGVRISMILSTTSTAPVPTHKGLIRAGLDIPRIACSVEGLGAVLPIKVGGLSVFAIHQTAEILMIMGSDQF